MHANGFTYIDYRYQCNTYTSNFKAGFHGIHSVDWKIKKAMDKASLQSASDQDRVFVMVGYQTIQQKQQQRQQQRNSPKKALEIW